MQLRPYQQLALEGIEREWERLDKTLLVLPTGTGKTIVFCKLAEKCVADGDKILILAHRGELLDQAADKMKQATGLGCAVEKADDSAMGSWFRITVGSVQSLMRESRLHEFPRDYYQKIIVDEAHHALADSYQRVLDYFEDAKVLGVTATPDRGDMKDLGTYFESIAFEYQLYKAIQDGYLSKIKAITVPLNIDLSGIKVQSGDFQAKAVGNALDPYLYAIADEMKQYCVGRKTVVFLPLIATSQKMQEILNERGFRCGEVNGESPDRAEILSDFHNGKYDVLCNSMLLTEGWDEPSVDCIVPLRPTKIRSLYAQMVGRGTRPCPETGKKDLLLLDFLWHTDRHDLCQPASLIAPDDEVMRKMTELAEEEAGVALDLEELERQAESDCVEEREEALAKKLEELRRKKRRLVDPLQFEMSIQAEDLINYQPAFGWEMQPVSDKQQNFLEKMGIDPSNVQCAGLASKLIDKVEKRKAAGLASAKQIRQLEMRGFQHVGAWTGDQAKNMITRIASNGWKTPRTVDPKTYKPPVVENDGYNRLY